MHRIALPLVLALAGCTAAPAHLSTGGSSPSTTRISTAVGDYEIQSTRDARATSHAVAAPPEQVWTALPGVYEELGIPITSINTSAMVLGNQQLSVNRRLAGERPSKYLDCGSGAINMPNADRYHLTLSLLTQLEPAPGGGTQVRSQLQGFAKPRSVSGNPINCSTSGILEERIVELLSERVGA
jgi:hypothetical protein